MEDASRDIEKYNSELYPVLVKGDVDLRKYHKIPVGEVASLGVGFNSISTAIQNYTTFANPELATSGLYHVTVGGGEHLTWSAGKNAYIGMSRNAANDLVSQAELRPVMIDPTMMFMAVAMMSVQMKMNAIQETQEEIMQFLEQKEKAELRGNIIVLNDIIEKYKYNWKNDQYLRNNHMKVLDIKQKAEQSIIFAQARIKEIIGKKKLIAISSDVNKRVKKLNKAFEDYQLAMYTFAMASYVETLLLKNFEKGYMNSVANKIEDYSVAYRELYTDVYNTLAQLSDKSVDNVILNSIGKASKTAGEAIAAMPIISKSELDENLIAVGDIIGESEESIKINKLSPLVSKQSSYVAPFVDNIKLIGELHDKPLNILFDKDNLYIEKPAA